MSHVAYERVMAHMYESCHVRINHVTYEWVMSHTNASRTKEYEKGTHHQQNRRRDRSALWCVRCNVLQCDAVCCSAMLCVAVCSIKRRTKGNTRMPFICYETSSNIWHIQMNQRTKECEEMCWSAMQCVAVCSIKRRTKGCTRMPFICYDTSCHIWMSRVIYKWVVSHTIESCHAWMSHATLERVMEHMKESCHVWMSHVIYEWVKWHTNELSKRTKECEEIFWSAMQRVAVCCSVLQYVAAWACHMCSHVTSIVK